jgi:pimeloyl-ACP methyl ester carboxylesterase
MQKTPQHGAEAAKFTAVLLLHGKAGSPRGTVRKLQDALEKHWPDLQYIRPTLPHSNPDTPAERSLEFLLGAGIPQGALLVGVSLGGLVAAKLQESGRPDLRVIAISAPTGADGVRLESWAEYRFAIYYSEDAVIAGRTADWPRLAHSYDLSWVTHDTDQHIPTLAAIIGGYIGGETIEAAIRRTCRHLSRAILKRNVIQCLWCRQILRRRGDEYTVLTVSDLGKGWYLDQYGWARERLR